jgi:hypothetical protein
MKRFQHSTKFYGDIVKASKDMESGDMEVTKASLDALESLVPSDIDFNRNFDLVAVNFNGAVANRFNANGDGISAATAVECAKHFRHKPTNIEHWKSDIVGHITNFGFSTFDDKCELLDGDLSDYTDPFNMAFSAVLYANARPYFVDWIMEAADPKSYWYQQISASWEIGFDDYIIALKSKDLSECEIVEDRKQVNDLKKYLLSNGGDGFLSDGTLVSRLVTGEVYPLGIGFTENPAAEVKGVAFIEPPEELDTSKIEDYVESNKTDKNEYITIESKEFLQKFKKNSSQANSQHVKPNNNTEEQTMELKEILAQLQTVIDSAKKDKNFKEESAANIGEIIKDAFKDENEKYVQKIEDQKNLVDQAKADKEAVAAELKELKEKSDAVQAELDSLKQAAADKASQDLFDSRMAVLAETYDLEDADRKVLASELNNLDDSDKAFADYKDRLSVLFQHKNKEYKQAQANEVQAKIDAAIAEAKGEKPKPSEDNANDTLQNAKPDGDVSNASAAEPKDEPTLREKFAGLLKERNKHVSIVK